MHETAFPREGSRLRVRTPKRRADDHTSHAQPNLYERQPERERQKSGAHEGGKRKEMRLKRVIACPRRIKAAALRPKGGKA